MNKKTDRNTTGLKQVLFEELDALRNGDSNPQKSRAVSSLIGGIIQTTRLEIEYHKLNPIDLTNDETKAIPMS